MTDDDFNEKLNELDMPSKVAVMMIAAHRDQETLEHMGERFSNLNEAFEVDWMNNDLGEMFQHLSKEVEYFRNIRDAAAALQSYVTVFVHKLEYENDATGDGQPDA